MTNNNDFALPWNASNPEDVAAANRQLAFQFGWFVDPIVFGKYPDEMTESIKDGRLPTFTPEEVAMVKGSYDFIGLNHYTSSFVKAVNNTGVDWDTDRHTEMTKYDVNGKLIGPVAESKWLNVYPQGLRGVLNWIKDRYNNSAIYMFENGVSVPGESDLPLADALHDNFRLNFYRDYISNLILAMTEDGVNVKSYFAWSLMDNFEWGDGYKTRFGLTYIVYSYYQERNIKDSMIWYTQFTRSGDLHNTVVNPHALRAELRAQKKEKEFLSIE